jgi:uncharacterized protein with ParB-like and HNH nuclease domain
MEGIEERKETIVERSIEIKKETIIDGSQEITTIEYRY